MYLIRIRERAKPGDNAEIATEFRSVSKIASLLENSERVVCYTVFHSGGPLTPRHFGYGDFPKWVRELYPETAQLLREMAEA